VTVQDDIFAWVQGFEPWKQELFRRTSASPTLSAADRQEVIAMLLGEGDGDSSPREVTRDDLPGAEGGEEPMLIESLSDLQAVNKIADGQEIGFEQGLNVVYGGNGAGKTGYSRVLKHAGRTLRPESVLANVASPSRGAPSATVNVVVGGNPEAVRLDLEQPGPAMLGRICIADADADDRYLTGDTEVDYVPASLASVSRLADGLKAMTPQRHGRAYRIVWVVRYFDLEGRTCYAKPRWNGGRSTRPTRLGARAVGDGPRPDPAGVAPLLRHPPARRWHRRRRPRSRRRPHRRHDDLGLPPPALERSHEAIRGVIGQEMWEMRRCQLRR